MNSTILCNRHGVLAIFRYQENQNEDLLFFYHTFIKNVANLLKI